MRTLTVLSFIDDKDILSKAVLKRIFRDIQDNISLYEPINEKLYFNDLEVHCKFLSNKGLHLHTKQLYNSIADYR